MEKIPQGEVSTTGLEHVLGQTHPRELEQFFREYESEMFLQEHPFAAYMRACILKRGKKLQEVFLAADIPEKYGYKLLSEEKRTRRRDVIVRLCLGARMNAEESDRALRLAGCPQLYPRLKRDAVLMIALNEGKGTEAADALLLRYGCEPLQTCGEE
ncbi:MAG: hypothetical protein ILP12_08065 [Lachnospiraceae bacterium]|nr:hypothetical protein [Lachnospiraceae bacterium]